MTATEIDSPSTWRQLILARAVRRQVVAPARSAGRAAAGVPSAGAPAAGGLCDAPAAAGLREWLRQRSPGAGIAWSSWRCATMHSITSGILAPLSSAALSHDLSGKSLRASSRYTAIVYMERIRASAHGPATADAGRAPAPRTWRCWPGVSTATVSRALNTPEHGRPGHARSACCDAAAKLRYVPHGAARIAAQPAQPDGRRHRALVRLRAVRAHHQRAAAAPRRARLFAGAGRAPLRPATRSCASPASWSSTASMPSCSSASTTTRPVRAAGGLRPALTC